MVKISLNNNDLKVVDLTKNTYLAEGPAWKFEFCREKPTDTTYEIKKDGIPIGNVTIGKMVDKDSTLFTLESFEEWKSNNVGKRNGGGASITTLTQAEYDALPASKETDGVYYFIISEE